MGLVGEGSECYGFDDEISQDHDFGLRVMVWLTREDHAQFGQQLQQALNCLPKNFGFAGEIQESLWGSTEKKSSVSMLSMQNLPVYFICLARTQYGGCSRNTICQWRPMERYFLILWGSSAITEILC